MNLKEEYQKLVDFVRYERHRLGLPNRNQDLAIELGYGATYFSSLVGKSGKVTEQHIRDIRLTFPDLFENQKHISKPSQPQPEISMITMSAVDRINELANDKKILQDAIASSIATIQASQQTLLSTMEQNHKVLIMVLDTVKYDTREIIDHLKGGQMNEAGKSGGQPEPPLSKGRKRA
jgi:hypothetical protein